MKDGEPAHRLNYDTLEKLDVVTGLLDYAALSAAHEEHLKTLYASSELKPFDTKALLPALARQQQLLRAKTGL